MKTGSSTPPSKKPNSDRTSAKRAARPPEHPHHGMEWMTHPQKAAYKVASSRTTRSCFSLFIIVILIIFVVAIISTLR